MLEIIVEESELAYRIVELKHRDDEGDKNPRCHPAMNDLFAAQQQEQGDCDGAKNIHQRRTDRSGGNRAQIGAEQASRRPAEPGKLPGFHAEGFHDAVAGDGLMQNVLNISEIVMSAAGSVSHAAADLVCRQLWKSECRWCASEKTPPSDAGLNCNANYADR